MNIKLNNIILLIATLVLQGLMIYSIYHSRLKYARNAPYYVANSLQYIDDYEDKLKDADFLANPEAFSDTNFSTAEVFAIDNSGNLTVDVNNLESGDYLPYSSLFKNDVGSTYHQGRFIGWAKHKDYTIIYRKYLSEVAYDNLAQTIVLWVLFFIIIYFNNRSRKIEEDNTIIENSGLLRIYLDIFKNYGMPRILIDESQEIVNVNKAFERTFKVRGDNLIGTKLKDFFGLDWFDLAKKFIESDKKYLETNTEWKGSKARLEINKTSPIRGKTYINAIISFING